MSIPSKAAVGAAEFAKEYRGSWDVGLAKEVETLVNAVVALILLDHPASVKEDPEKHYGWQREYYRNKVRSVFQVWLDRHAISLRNPETAVLREKLAETEKTLCHRDVRVAGERASLIVALVDLYYTAHREGWEPGESTDEVCERAHSLLCNLGYDPYTNQGPERIAELRAALTAAKEVTNED